VATITGSYPAVTLQDIEALESRKQLSLPDDYKKFLLRSNGGRPTPAGFEVPGWPGRASSVHEFYGIHSREHCNLEFWIDEHSDRLPAGFITIGSDPGANALCMATTGKNRGKIYYWDSSPDWDLPPESGTMFLVGEDIDHFLENLKDPDDLPPPDLSKRLGPPFANEPRPSLGPRVSKSVWLSTLSVTFILARSQRRLWK
jgi:hypothetical protein